MDGFPVTKEQVDLMTEHSIIPVVVLELKVDSRALMMRGMKDRQSPDRSVFRQKKKEIVVLPSSWSIFKKKFW